jgi:hypothetical protein
MSHLNRYFIAIVVTAFLAGVVALFAREEPLAWCAVETKDSYAAGLHYRTFAWNNVSSTTACITVDSLRALVLRKELR